MRLNEHGRVPRSNGAQGKMAVITEEGGDGYREEEEEEGWAKDRPESLPKELCMEEEEKEEEVLR